MSNDNQVAVKVGIEEKSLQTASQELTQPPKYIEKEGQVEFDISPEQAADSFGTSDLDLINVLQQQTLSPLGKDLMKANGSLAMLHGINPRDELEGMLATQMVAIHNMSMEMMRRTMKEGQAVEVVSGGVNRVIKLTRTFTAQMEALQRYRKKGEQKIKVQHVHVNEGGQAIVGDVKTRGDRE